MLYTLAHLRCFGLLVFTSSRQTKHSLGDPICSTEGMRTSLGRIGWTLWPENGVATPAPIEHALNQLLLLAFTFSLQHHPSCMLLLLLKESLLPDVDDHARGQGPHYG